MGSVGSQVPFFREFVYYDITVDRSHTLSLEKHCKNLLPYVSQRVLAMGTTCRTCSVNGDVVLHGFGKVVATVEKL